ncbi:unnamed protein product [Echinostoma caproni]|uniref:Avl9 domain-containing protein n=1 Tax=Echinostoma caproni TaxID=27848 RepID=A0A183B9K3_9TREM|nr:unnamed protein product [Echinostoma caproni]
MSGGGCILHVISVGFHHRRGSTVEETIELPSKWKHLASLALPDGAHNYLKDIIYFTLPSIEKDEHAVFGVASYRQAYSTVSLWILSSLVIYILTSIIDHLLGGSHSTQIVILS